jgi:hypothetical protein
MTRIIRYRTQPSQAAANEELVRAVFAELQVTQPDGLTYAVYRRGVSIEAAVTGGAI